MVQCASVRKKGSYEQCPTNAVLGHTLCGRHARCKEVVLWANIYRHEVAKMIRLQAWIRGWLVRRRLALGGPGVLSRNNLANHEDVVTCEERVHPFEYFAFDENGKIWWFTFPTIWRWVSRSHEPINPYTKVALTADTLKRLHACWGYRFRHHMRLPDEPTQFSERLRGRWNIVCQVFANYGFGTIDPEPFMALKKWDYHVMFRFILDDLRILDAKNSNAIRYVLRSLQHASVLQTDQYRLQSMFTLMMVLLEPRNAYMFVFVVMSALFRLG